MGRTSVRAQLEARLAEGYQLFGWLDDLARQGAWDERLAVVQMDLLAGIVSYGFKRDHDKRYGKGRWKELGLEPEPRNRRKPRP